jgi:hypothetical protein
LPCSPFCSPHRTHQCPDHHHLSLIGPGPFYKHTGSPGRLQDSLLPASAGGQRIWPSAPCRLREAEQASFMLSRSYLPRSVDTVTSLSPQRIASLHFSRQRRHPTAGLLQRAERYSTCRCSSCRPLLQCTDQFATKPNGPPARSAVGITSSHCSRQRKTPHSWLPSQTSNA